MAHAIETRTNNPANQLRDNLAEVERLIVNVDPENVETLLVTLDELERQFEALAGSDLDLRAESGRWESVQTRITNKPAGIVSAGRKAGGWEELRARNAPASNSWWRLDKLLASRRNQLLLRTLLMIGGVVAGLVFVFWTINTLFPPSPEAVLLLETNTQVSDQLATQDFDGAMAVIEKAQLSLPDDPELISWEVALAEQLDDEARAKAASTRLQELMVDEPALFWLTLSERRIAIGDLVGAEDAATQAAAIEPNNPRPYYLLANIAEFRGDYTAAIDLFEKTYELAEESAPDLAAISRVRMGTLMQSGGFAVPGSEVTPTP